MQQVLNRLFKLTENKTTINRELVAGLTTFLTMSYIIFVNPAILSTTGMNAGAVYVATCLVTIIGSVLVAFLANYPIAVAPGMAVNIFFAYTVVQSLGYSWQLALGMVFISGVIFFLITLTKARLWVIESMPENINLAIAVGLGMFIAIIALENAGIVIKPSGKALLTMGDVRSWQSLLFFIGFLIIVVLDYFRVHGAMIISILLITLVSLVSGLAKFHGVFALPPSLAPTLLAVNIQEALHYKYLPIIFTFFLVVFFDSTGTLMGILRQSLFRQDEQRSQRISRALIAESGATICGSLLGTASTSPYIESAAGIEAGGRTGLTALTIGVLFFVALFLSPLAMAIPSYAVAPALLYVGILMMKNVVLFRVDDPTDFIPCILIAIMIPFTFSIADGLGIGIIVYVVLKLFTGKVKALNPMLYFITLVFLAYFAFMLR
ncbi:MAG TPA: NCS2 family permease [Gammaproteobacteria bacterium]|nr:NCS2 family permease [Gammaproteobacteria bacterium]